MKKQLQFEINMNGDSATTLIEQYRAIRLKAVDLAESMAAMRPHERNYQTVSDPYQMHNVDRDMWEEMIRVVSDIADVSDDAQMKAHNAKNKITQRCGY